MTVFLRTSDEDSFAPRADNVGRRNLIGLSSLERPVFLRLFGGFRLASRQNQMTEYLKQER